MNGFTARRFLITILFLHLVFAMPRTASAGAPLEQAAVMFLLDDSGSMLGNDPHNQRYAASALFLAALDAGDQVGALRFSTTTQQIFEGMQPITGEAEKVRLVEQLQPAGADGYTDMKAAFLAARDVLDTADLDNTRTMVVILTDGKPEVPSMSAGYQDEALEAARALGVPVYAIALTYEGQSAFLARVAQETGGQVIPAVGADDLLDSFLHIFI